MKKLLQILMLSVMITVYSTNSFGWVPVVIPHAHHNHNIEMKTDGQEIYKHSLGILIGKEIRGCKIIDAFYWDHKINMICIKDNEFYKMKVSVYDMKETYKDGTFKTRVDVDVSKEVADIFQGEINGETIQK